MKITKNDWLFGAAVLFAVWFALTGIFWVYWTALIVAYPFGIVSFLIWMRIRKDAKKRNIAIPLILIAGLLLSAGMLLALIFGRS